MKRLELNFEDLEMQKRNIPTDIAQRVDEKNGAISLMIIFTPGLMVIKISKMPHFFYFLLMAAKNQSQGEIFKCVWNILFSSFRKCYE